MDAGSEFLDEPDLVRLIKDAEVLLVAKEVGMLAEQPHAESVEGGERN